MSEPRWTDEQAYNAAMVALHDATSASTAWDVAWLPEGIRPQVERALGILGRALLDERDRAEKAEALVAVLKAEVRAWRVFEDHPANDQLSMECIVEWQAVVNARAATDAALGKEGL